MAFFALMPETTSRPPSRSVSAPSSQWRPDPFFAAGSGRLRIAVTMFMRLTRQAEAPTTTKVSSTPIA